jgi:hypothetical protein
MQSASLQQFRGLSLNADPEKAGPYATDLLNVQFDRPDRVRTRDGYGRLNSVAVPGPVVGIARYAGAYGANPQYVVAYTSGANTIAKVYDSTGAAVGATQTIGGVFLGFVSTEYGTGTSNYLYVANATDTNFVTATFRWDGAVWTSPAGLPTRNAGLAVSPLDNRMVTLAGATGVRSRIHFSNAGDAETYGPNNYVDLHPNDGEYLAGLVAWKDILVAFKQTKYFVFWGTGVDGTGQPIFNYRTVDSGVGVATGYNQAVAGRKGIYFADRSGIWVTTGGDPVMVSAAINPYLHGLSVPSFQGTAHTTWEAAPRISFANDKLYVSSPAAPTSECFVLDELTGEWSFYNLGIQQAVSSYTPTSAQPMTMFADGTSAYINRHDQTYTTDNGSAISSRYRSGFLDFGYPAQEKRIRSMNLTGTGTVNVKIATNDSATLGTATSVALGTSPAVAEGYYNGPGKARNFSIEVSSTTAQWSLSSLTANIATVRQSGLRAA